MLFAAFLCRPLAEAFPIGLRDYGAELASYGTIKGNYPSSMPFAFRLRYRCPAIVTDTDFFPSRPSLARGDTLALCWSCTLPALRISKFPKFELGLLVEFS